MVVVPVTASGQQKLTLSLEEAVMRAQNDSPAAISAKHSFRASYWSWRSFKADQLPSLTFRSSPSLNRSYNAITKEDGTTAYVNQNQLSTDARLDINQKVALTGGTIYASTYLQRTDLFGDNKGHSYMSNPITIGYSQQNLFGYNSQKWQRKIQPLNYEYAKKYYISTMEIIASTATSYFFDLATAQNQLDMAMFNLMNCDTLLSIGIRRYEKLGTITENEMLQLELNRLNQETSVLTAQIDVDDRIATLRSYLGITDDVEIDVITDTHVPDFTVDEELAYNLALENNPSVVNWEIQRLSSESSVASARSQGGFSASLGVEFGLNQSGREIRDVYQNPNDREVASIGISIPILDWGRHKGEVRVARSNRDRIYASLEQERIDFRTSILRAIRQFNIQGHRIMVARKADETARRKYDVAQKLFVLGKSSTLELTNATAEKDQAGNSYINALWDYWSKYYSIRRLTGFDFESQRPLTEDYDTLIQ